MCVYGHKLRYECKCSGFTWLLWSMLIYIWWSSCWLFSFICQNRNTSGCWCWLVHVTASVGYCCLHLSPPVSMETREPISCLSCRPYKSQQIEDAQCLTHFNHTHMRNSLFPQTHAVSLCTHAYTHTLMSLMNVRNFLLFFCITWMHAPSSPIRAAADASVWCACDITSQEQRAAHCDEAEWVSVSRSVFTHAYGKQAHRQTQGHGTQTRHDVSTWFVVVCVHHDAHNAFF